jgi:hypothetical protein
MIEGRQAVPFMGGCMVQGISLFNHIVGRLEAENIGIGLTDEQRFKVGMDHHALHRPLDKITEPGLAFL